MAENQDMVMRSIYLPPRQDSQLRQLAHDLKVTKSELIRSAIGVKLKDWLASNSNELVLSDLAFGKGGADEPVRATDVTAHASSGPVTAPDKARPERRGTEGRRTARPLKAG